MPNYKINYHISHTSISNNKNTSFICSRRSLTLHTIETLIVSEMRINTGTYAGTRQVMPFPPTHPHGPAGHALLPTANRVLTFIHQPACGFSSQFIIILYQLSHQQMNKIFVYKSRPVKSDPLHKKLPQEKKKWSLYTGGLQLR